jgi:hypothetical protein
VSLAVDDGFFSVLYVPALADGDSMGPHNVHGGTANASGHDDRTWGAAGSAHTAGASRHAKGWLR